MPRIARGVLDQGIFHVLNRGNHRQTLFHRRSDYAEFIELLRESVEKFQILLWGYCLMGNHWHLVAQVQSARELGRWVHWLSNRHVRRVHRANPALGGGHIYQGRYKSFPVQDESYLCQVLRYVEANPLARWLGHASAGLALVEPVGRADLSWPGRSRATKADGLDARRPLARVCQRAVGHGSTDQNPAKCRARDAAR